MDRRENEFDRPFRGHARCLQRIGEAKATHDEIWFVSAATVELLVDILSFAKPRLRGKPLEFLRQQVAIEVRRADLERPHAQLFRQEARQRRLEL